jgi:hypothetical protein
VRKSKTHFEQVPVKVLREIIREHVLDADAIENDDAFVMRDKKISRPPLASPRKNGKGSRHATFQ